MMMRHAPDPHAPPLWRRALQALAHAFDPAREADDHDTVFQTRAARSRHEGGDAEDPHAPAAPPSKETLQ